MAEQMLNQVPYECTLAATDTKSGKPITNILYYRDLNPGGIYAAPIVGSDQATFNAALLAAWTGNILSVLSSHYVMTSLRTRAIVGWKWGTPLRDLAGSTPSLTFTSLTTGQPHGFTSGNAVAVLGTAGVTGLNGVHGPITVTSANQFTIPVALTGTLSVQGTVQEVLNDKDFTYANQLETADTSAGSKTGEAAPLFCSASVRRLNTGVGRNWKSRISLSPFAEDQVENGKFSTTALTAIQTAVDFLNNSLGAGGGQSMWSHVVSRQLAFLEATPFTNSTQWSTQVTDFQAQPNMGSIVSRKPRLTSTIGSG